jgi:4-amino-4-deoxy-L-arabinose transferase-like glycosyltransferase
MNNSRLLRRFMILLVFIAGIMLRFHNLNWDNGLLFHPDELNIGIAVTRVNLFTSLDPGFYAYNGLTIYLYKALGHLTGFLTGNSGWHTDLGKILLIGRHVSAVASSISLLLIYLLARRFFDKPTAFLALSLMAFNTGLIQCAHFAVTESLLTFFLLLAALLTDYCRQKENAFARLLPCLVCDLAIACKTSALSFLLIPFSAFFIGHAGRPDLAAAVKKAFFCTFILLIVFIAASPYSLINYRAFASSMTYEGGVVHGSIRVPYTLQFCNTIPYYPWLASLYWLCSPLPAITGGIGLLILLITGIRLFISPQNGRCAAIKLTNTENGIPGRIRALPLLLFALFYAMYIGTWHTKFVRYLIPLLPIIILGSAWACIKIKMRFNRTGTIILGAVLVSSGIWSACFFSIYCRPSTRIAASSWLYENLPPKAE